ncbi:MAG: hypothetical protein IPK15_20985 [Verrucomicrobia bacterium]|nr:hypothetical protein [Verrucomicrobiota bacterium]
MNPKFKVILYLVLGVCLASFSAAFYATYHAKDASAAVTAPATNASSATVSNVVAGVTNQAPALVANPDEELTVRKRSPRAGRLAAYGIAMFFSVIGLAVMIGYDVSKFFANRVNEFIFNDNLEGVRSPEMRRRSTSGPRAIIWARWE